MLPYDLRLLDHKAAKYTPAEQYDLPEAEKSRMFQRLILKIGRGLARLTKRGRRSISV